MTNHTDEHEVQRKVRSATKLEVGLGVVGIGQLVAVIWFAATLNANVKQLQAVVADLSRTVATIQASAPRIAVLEYRVDQLEKRQ